MNILKYPDPHLLKPTKEVTVFGPELLILLESMYETMLASNGIGLAANQLGLEYKMFVMRGPNDKKYFFINPILKSQSLAPAMLSEGCLSAPGEILVVPGRVGWVEVAFQNENGEKMCSSFSGIHSVCIQHEMDHLRGRSHLNHPSLPRSVRKIVSKKWSIPK